jgi:Ca2+-binding RTX toxin-like protein
MRRNKSHSVRKFERLEDRRMMAGDIDFDDGVLTIDGAGLNDVAEIRFEGDQVRVDLFAGTSGGGTDHHDRDKDITDVDRIVFNGFAGNDTVRVFVNALDSGETIDNIVLEFNGGDNDDTLDNDPQGGMRVDAKGGAGRDILEGSRFDDVLEGGAGNDDLLGGNGNDRYVFAGTALGLDTVVEASNVNTDTLDYTNMGHFTGVNIGVAFAGSNPQNAFNFAGTTLRLSSATGIEDVIGSAFGDVITGNSRDNHLMGLGDGDRLKGAGGNDKLEGGVGNDTYEFAGSNLGTDEIIEAANADNDLLRFSGMDRGLVIDLTKSGSAFAVDSPDLKLKLSNDTAIERVFGTDFSDVIIGNSRNNELRGDRGNDIIVGNGGADVLRGGDDTDQLFTDALDQAFGEGGVDLFDGFNEAILMANPRPGRYMDWRVF